MDEPVREVRGGRRYLDGDKTNLAISSTLSDTEGKRKCDRAFFCARRGGNSIPL